MIKRMHYVALTLLCISTHFITCVEYSLAPTAEESNNAMVPTLKLLIKQGNWKEFNERAKELKKPSAERGIEYPFNAFENLGFDITMHEYAIKVARDLCNPAIKQLVDDLENKLQAMKEKKEPAPATNPSADPSMDQIMERFRGRIDDLSKLRATEEKEWKKAGLFDDNRKRALAIMGDKRMFSGKCLPIITITMARFCNQSEDERATYIESQLSGIAQALALLKEIEKGSKTKIHTI